MLSAHRVESQGRPRTTSSSQLISQIGLPVRASLSRPLVPEAPCFRRGRTAVSCPDNAKAYHSHLWRDTCAELEIERRYTRPYSPWTNGKAEALVKTLLREWAYRFAYPTSVHRARALPGYLRWYNRRRPHGSLGARPPVSRVSDVCGQYT